ncbi:low-density lipoprotein receptor-related protein 8-like [Seriola lalandi dorsalis]|uniref:Low-density lipoprotein receptor-related protein 8-like n=1 Tax=Seriola lalandi dorsalis TaxID=1841481 RepID=A0A3B4YX86_SERLL|nr:low-density lipoprotein receptor-related protein 8-like [Seriola lalandi dorsalis]
MGHLGGLFLLVVSVSWHYILGSAGHSLPACHEQLEFRCSDGSCISGLKLCDSHTDCKDGSDEQHCSHARCKKDEFACRSRRCISKRFLCNGVDDCGDGSDEDSCQNCPPPFFSCGLSDICLPRHKLCDGRTDCKDGWDESQELCGLTQPRPQTSPKCAASEFQCGNGQCISQAWRCDHSPDCSDGSDEDDCRLYQNLCQVNNGGCSHECVDQPMGFLCLCPDNMRLVMDSQCEDVDMCLETDVCDQLCVHMNGSLTCDCLEGYTMNPTTRECKAKGDEAQLVFTSSKGMQRSSIPGTEHRELAPHLPGPGPVAALISNSTLYWAQKGRGSIYRVSMDGKDAMLVLKVKGSVSALAVDWIHQLLYWTSMESGSVNVGLLDGSAQRQLITGLDKPSAVAVDPLQGLLFWAQCGSFPKIERASLDGRDRITLVTSLIRHPVALSLDVPRQLLYWVDQGMRSISRVNLEGRERKTVVESNGYLDRPLGLAVFEGFVYWSEEVTRSICRANKHNGRQLQVLLTNITSPGSVVISQPVLQPNGPSVCGRPGTMCQHKCVVNLLSDIPEFSCIFPETRQNKSQSFPAISRTVPATTLSDPTFTGILSLIVFLTLLLVGMAVWWWREECSPSKSLIVQSFYLKESQDPLITRGPPMGPNSCLTKETLPKLDLDNE